MRKVLTAIFLFLLVIGQAIAQTDSSGINKRLKEIETELKSNPLLKKHYEDLTFYYSQVMKYHADSLNASGFKLTGYMDAYYGHYSDRLPVGSYQKFPTSAPISDAFGLNMAMLSLQYQNENVNGILTCHAGDIASSAWSSKHNFIQEAHLGLRLVKKLWLEGGYFRTHLGFESIQPRENIGTSVALTTYYEPYYLSGAKLTYFINDKLSVQVNAFNGFNTFVAINRKKTFGLTTVYEANKNFIISFNSLLSNEQADSIVLSKRRLYNDLYFAYKSKRFNLGFETNFGIQENSDLEDSSKTAYMFSMTLAGKYKIKNDRYSVYARVELFDDRNEILTGPVNNANHQLVGINAFGGNAGLEFKPLPNSYLRFEGRYLHLWNNENIFYTRSKYTNVRLEWIAAMGVWF